jgi:hypothetical protein
VAAALQKLIAEVGESKAAEQLHPLTRHTVARLAAGMVTKPATLIVAADRLHVIIAGSVQTPGERDPAISRVRPTREAL